MAENAPRLRDLLTRGAARLRASGSETPALDASLLLAHLLGMDRAALYARTTDPAPPGIAQDFDNLIVRRAAQVPVAYLTGVKEFMGLPFAVTPAVLVPRPETELLVQWAVGRLQRFSERTPRPVEQAPACQPACTLTPAPPYQVRSARVVDVGTGSGAIAVAVAHAASGTTVVASDISLEALHIARANARRNHVENRVAFVCGGLLTWLGDSVDLVLANLPYLTDEEAASPGIAAEPRLALAGGDDDGFALYRALIPQGVRCLTPGGAFAFEIGPAQAEVARDACARAIPDATIIVHDDLAGLARFVTIETAV